MTIAELMQPFAIFFNWFRTFQMHIGEVSISFMDIFTWTMLASVVIGFIIKLRE